MMRAVHLAFWSIRLSLSDLWVAKIRTCLEVVGIGLTLGLMVLLWGLKSGIVSGFATEQLDTPEATRIFVSGFDAISQQEIEWLLAQPETGFVAPNSSYINSRVPFATSKERKVDVLMIPTGLGDPHLPAGIQVPASGETVLGNDTASALGAQHGDMVTITLPPVGKRKEVAIKLKVIGIAATSSWFQRAAFLAPSLIAAIDIRGFEPKIVFDGSAQDFGLTPNDKFPSVRLYAKTLEAVAPLVKKLNVVGWNAQSREQLINERNALENAIDVVFWLVFALAFVALSLSILFGLISRSLRLSRPLKALRANGMVLQGAFSILLLQAAFLSIGAWIAATLIAAGGTVFLNRLLPPWIAEFGISGPPVIIEHYVFLKIGLLGLVLTLAGSCIAMVVVSGGNDLSVSWDE